MKFPPKDIDKLIEGLAPQGKVGSKLISIKRVKDALKAAENKQKPTVEGVRSRMARFDAKVQAHLQKISDFLKKNSMSTSELHSKLDADGDGKVDKREFVTRMRDIGVPGLVPADLGLIFDSLDINDDGGLSPHEFSLFLEGA